MITHIRVFLTRFVTHTYLVILVGGTEGTQNLKAIPRVMAVTRRNCLEGDILNSPKRAFHMELCISCCSCGWPDMSTCTTPALPKLHTDITSNWP